jgi:hypothetical protein
MNSFFRCLIKSVGLLGLWIMIFPYVGATYEPIPAELTANTNLRETPDINGNIIVVLKRWDRILIQDEKPDWANVVYEKNGNNINGWVFAKYLLKTAVAPQEPKTRDLADKPNIQAPQSFPDTGLANSAPPPERIVEAAEKQRTIVSEPLPPPDKSVPNKTSRPLSGDDVSAFFKNKEDSSIIADNLNLKSGQASYYELIGGITRFLFKISLIIMSCVALFFSYSALEIAKSNRYVQSEDDKYNLY